MKISFTVPGQPTGKGRPRFSKRGEYVTTYTDEKTVIYENLIRTEYIRQCGSKRFQDDEPLDLRVLAYYPIPASGSKKRIREMEEGTVRPTKRPDGDNLLKVVADSLNQLAYRDDAQVVDSQVRKFYSRQPRVEITIQSARGA